MSLKRQLYHPVKNKLAKYYLKYLVKNGCQVIGITGSAGKTTTKEMIASILSQKYKTVKTHTNIDPVYNIPATILKTPIGTQKLVLEMGIEYPGEMDFYINFTNPDVGVVTNIYWTHTEFFGNVDGVYKEKVKLISSLSSNGFAVLNKDDIYIRKMSKLTKARIVWYSVNKKADISGSNIKITKKFQTEFTLAVGGIKAKVTLPVLGRHFVSLALGAAAVGHINKLTLKEIKYGLENFPAPPQRMVISKLKNETILIDDTYNANPLATIEAINVLSEFAKSRRKILVLGEMKELGSYKQKGHIEVGKAFLDNKLDVFYGLGGLTRFTANEIRKDKSKIVFLLENKNDLIKKLKKNMQRGDVVLVKGSRSMAMEEVVLQLKK